MHANTQVPKVIGFERISELSGNEDYHMASSFFWDIVTGERSLAFGGNSRREHFPAKDACMDFINDIDGPESCNTNNILKLTEDLHRRNPEARYADYYELATFNHILSTQHPEHGGYVYFTPARPRHYRNYSAPNEAMWCCVGTGMENHGKYGQFIYTHVGDALFVNLYAASQLDWKERGITLRQETAFPYSENSTITIAEGKGTFNLMVRYPGWVHPGEFKVSVNGKPVDIITGPSSYVSINRKWKKGDVVKVGTKIAEAGGFVSAAIFSSVSGKVNKVDAVIDASGYRKPAIFIDVDGDEWEESIDRSSTLVKECALTPEEIVAKVKNAGVVGMGGACFPTHVKLSPPPGCKAECVIINAVECEPYLTADHRLMLEKADEVLVGVSILMKAAKVTKGYIGIENNKPDAIKLMTEKAAQYPGIEVVPLQVKYPQGGEKQLIDAVIGRQVPAPPAIPINVGAVVQNVGTAFAVYEAVQKNKPLFERIVTVTGKSVKNPSNFLTRMGTPMSQLIDAAGGLPEDTGKVIGGGPMMGKALVNTEVPICKGSSGVLIMNDKEAARAEAQPCIRCAKCVSVCPMGLEPFLLATLSAHKDWERVEKEDVMSCIECGSCQFTCPSHRYLLDYIRLGKGTVGGIIRARNAKK